MSTSPYLSTPPHPGPAPESPSSNLPPEVGTAITVAPRQSSLPVTGGDVIGLSLIACGAVVAGALMSRRGWSR